MPTAENQLLSIIQRIERLTEEKKSIGDDITDVYAEAKASGYDVKALRQIIKERAQDPSERATHESIVATYRRALGMLDGTPLGNAALAQATRPAPRRRADTRGEDTRMAG